MKRLTYWMLIPVAATMFFAATSPVWSETVQINSGSQPDPQVTSGTSGGSQGSDCGYISAKPNQVIKVTEPLPYMRLNIQSAGEPTLLIDGPGGRFCVLADGSSGDGPHMSGYWAPGNYAVYVGDRAHGNHPYTLSISRTPQ